VYKDDQTAPYFTTDAYSPWMRVANLTPQTKTTLWVRAQDYDGNLSPMSAAISFTTGDFDGALVAKASTPPAIDGTIADAEWKGSQLLGFGHAFRSGFTTGIKSYSAEFRTLWDAQNLYIAVDVTDDKLFSDAAIFEFDNVQVYICDEAQRVEYSGAIPNFQYAVSYDAKYSTTSKGAATGVVAKSTTTTAGYALEFSLPWSLIGLSAATNFAFAFDIGGEDTDTTGFRNGQTEWWGTALDFACSALWGKAKLVDTYTEPTVAAFNLKNPRFAQGGDRSINAAGAYNELLRGARNGLEIYSLDGKTVGVSKRIRIDRDIAGSVYIVNSKPPRGSILKKAVVQR
jgi:hypothetical protein